MMRKAASLVDLCVQNTIDNIIYLGDVGDTADHLLERILSHCTHFQLMRIENSTKGRDLSPVTDKLWKRFRKDRLGEDKFNTVLERMRQEKVTFTWRQLYEADLQHWFEVAKKCIDRHKEEKAKKRTTIFLKSIEVRPSGMKRSYSGGVTANNIYNTKSSTTKKAKLDLFNRREVKNIAAKKTKVVGHRNYSVPSKAKPALSSRLVASFSSSSSSNKLIKSFRIGL